MNTFLPSSATGTAVVWHHRDDRDAQLIQMTSTLNCNGYQTLFLESQYQVAKSVASQQVDLLIIHLQTSGQSGYDLCKILRAQAVTRYLPVVFVGYREDSSERDNALRCGGNEYIRLPIDAEESWLRIEQHLNVAYLVRQLQADRMSLSQKIGEYSSILAQQEQLKVSLAEENRELQKLAFVDGLTQVANRRSFNQNIARLWQDAARRQQPLSLLLCDIDYFKRYNDTYGHTSGDGCLKAVAAALSRGAHRHQDQVSRYGGEEFAILLPGTDSLGAQQVALAVQSELAQMQLPHRASLVKPWVSLSIGICTMVPESGAQRVPECRMLPCEALIQKADEALYTAKLRGRDRTVISTPTELLSVERSYCLCDYTAHSDAFNQYRGQSERATQPVKHVHNSSQAARRKRLFPTSF